MQRAVGVLPIVLGLACVAAVAGALVSYTGVLAQPANADDYIQEFVGLARASDPGVRNVTIAHCVITSMRKQHGADAAGLVVKAAAAQARGDRTPPEAVSALTVLIPIAVDCSSDYDGQPAPESRLVGVDGSVTGS